MSEPEHTDVVQVAVWCAVRTQSSSFSSRVCSTVVIPPGTKMTSGEGVSANEWVAPMTRTSESAVIGPGSCQTKRTCGVG